DGRPERDGPRREVSPGGRPAPRRGVLPRGAAGAAGERPRLVPAWRRLPRDGPARGGRLVPAGGDPPAARPRGHVEPAGGGPRPLEAAGRGGGVLPAGSATEARGRRGPE